jgi:hypothetical protein
MHPQNNLRVFLDTAEERKFLSVWLLQGYRNTDAFAYSNGGVASA